MRFDTVRTWDGNENIHIMDFYSSTCTIENNREIKRYFLKVGKFKGILDSFDYFPGMNMLLIIAYNNKQISKLSEYNKSRPRMSE